MIYNKLYNNNILYIIYIYTVQQLKLSVIYKITIYKNFDTK